MLYNPKAQLLIISPIFMARRNPASIEKKGYVFVKSFAVSVPASSPDLQDAPWADAVATLTKP